MAHVAVVGGGIGGLVAAITLAESPQKPQVTLFEASPDLGGLLKSEVVQQGGPWVIEHGPDSILIENGAILRWADKLGLTDRLVRTRTDRHGAYFRHHGSLARLPTDFALVGPKHWPSLLRTPLLSLGAKLRAGLEPLVGAKRGTADESLADFVTRRFGKGMVYLVEPLAAGIYGGDANELSMSASFERFCEQERKYGSLLKAFRRAAASPSESGARYGLFVAFKEGMSELVQGLARYAKNIGVTIRTNTLVSSVTKVANQFEVCTNIRATYDGVFLALPAPAASTLLKDVATEAANALSGIELKHAATVTLGFDHRPTSPALDGYGYVVPRGEQTPILAATWSSEKWPGRAPLGTTLIRFFIRPSDALLSDEELSRLALQETNQVFKGFRAPIFTKVLRYPAAMPQYKVGHLTIRDQVESGLIGRGRLGLTSNSVFGVGIATVLDHSESAAKKLAAELA